jgi:Family of unknown function (DUF6545)
MSMLMLVALLAMWSAAAYRIGVALRQPATRRTEFAIWVTFVAAAATGYALRPQIDAAVGIPNITNLGSRIALCIAIAAGQLFLRDMRSAKPNPRGRHWILASSLVTAAISVIAWCVAPLHDAEHLDLATVHPSIATWLYAVAIYVYAGWAVIVTTTYVSRNLDALRRTDPPAAVAAFLVRASGWTGVPVLILWGAHVTVAQATRAPEPYLERVSSVLFPVSLALMGAGLLMIPLLPVMQHHRNARRMSGNLQPLWETLLTQHPEVRLPRRGLPMAGWLRPRITAQRQLIEVSDALEEHWVSSIASLEALAAALRSPQAIGSSQNAKDVLLALDHTPWPAPLLHLSDAVTRTREPSHAS